MTVVNMYEAKAQLSKLVKKALMGEEVILAKAGESLVKLVPVLSEKRGIKFGALKGKIHMDEDFDDFGPDMQELFKDYI